MSFDISTHQLGEQTAHSMPRGIKASLDEILSMWHAVGTVIRQQLSQRKAVRLSSLGTFSLTSAGEPAFVMSQEFAKEHRIKQRGASSVDNLPTAALNLVQLSGLCNLPRDIVDKIYSKFLNVLSRTILEGRSVLLTIHKVAEIVIAKGELVCNFMPDPSNPRRGASGARGIQEKSSTQPTSGLNIAKAAGGMGTGRVSALPHGRERNPIIGGVDDDADGIRAPPPRPRPRNPIIEGDGTPRAPPPRAATATGNGGAVRRNSVGGGAAAPLHRPSSAQSYRSSGTRSSADTMSLLHSPRSQASSNLHLQARPSAAAAAGATGQRRGGGGLNREDLERHSSGQAGRPPTPPARRAGSGVVGGGGGGGGISTKNGIADPRAVAAKALGAGDIVQKVRTKIVDRGGSNGIKSLARLLAIMDDNGDKKLSKEELKYGLRDYGIDLSPTEIEQIFQYFDRDGNGYIDFDEFLVGMRGEMNDRRKIFVKMAFDTLDTDRSGTIDVDEIMAKYDMSWNPDVRAGRKTVKEAAREFMSVWEQGERDGQVTFAEFLNHYKDVSASIDDDDYFELMMRNAWRIAGGEGAAANTANKRVLVTDKSGNQRVETVQDELGMKYGDVEDVRRRLGRQGVDASNVELYGGMDSTDKKGFRARPQGTAAAAAAAGGGRNKDPVAEVGIKEGRSAVARAGGGGEGGGRAGVAGWGFASDENEPPPPPRGGAENRPSSATRPARAAPPAPPTANATPSSGSGGFDAWLAMRKLLYSPPTSLEQLGGKLQVSIATFTPRVARGAFISRLGVLDPSLSRSELAALWSSVDPTNKGYLELQIFHDMLTQRFGKDKSSAKGSGVIEKVIARILERSGKNGGIKGLSRALSIMDNNGDKKLTKEEMKYGLQDFGIELNIRETDEIFHYFDRDRSGTIDFDEFLVGIRGDLNDRRKRLVQMAFDILDTDGSGAVTPDEIAARYDVSHSADVVSGRKTKEEALKEFMRTWDRSNDGVVTYEEFEDYYKEISASIDGDDYFELMMRNAWRIAGGEGAAANTANKRVLVTDKSGNQRVETVQDELGMKYGDVEDVRRRLGRQGVDASNVELYGGMDSTEKARNQRGRPSSAPRLRAVTAGFAAGGGVRGAGVGTIGRPAAAAAAPTRANSSQLQSSAAAATQSRTRGAFERHVVAVKLAAAFRGRVARKKAAQEKRKVDAQQQERAAQVAEENRQKARKITRPQGKSYIGF